MTKRKFSRSDFAALNRKVAGVYYPRDQRPAQLTTARKPLPRRKGRRPQ